MSENSLRSLVRRSYVRRCLWLMVDRLRGVRLLVDGLRVLLVCLLGSVLMYRMRLLVCWLGRLTIAWRGSLLRVDWLGVVFLGHICGREGKRAP